MQRVNIRHNLFDPTNLKYVEINNLPKHNGTHQKNFMNGLQNARNILESLERSLRKTRMYERQLVRCKASHAHSHDGSEWWDDPSDDKDSKCSKSGCTMKSPRSRVGLAESWSTMSIVCLQYQYEELSKRYASLLRAYNERWTSLQTRDAALARLRLRASVTRARLVHGHKTMLAVGEKYLALRDRRVAQKLLYEEKISKLEDGVREVMSAAERARMDMDVQIASFMAVESDAATSLLLAEIRKCNLLYFENLRLKSQVEELAPGNVNWDSN